MTGTTWSSPWRAIGGAFLLGTASMMAELVLLREFLGAFAGNELIIGLVLGFWFVLTAVGAEFGRRWRKDSTLGIVVGLETAAGLAPLLQIIAIRLVRATLLPGVAPGPGLALGSTALILLPGCVVNGWLFAALVRLATEARGEEPGRTYLVETIGLAVGGLVYSVMLCPRLGSFDLAVLIAVQNGLAAVLVAGSGGRPRLALASGAALALSVLATYGFQLDARTLRPLYPGGNLVTQVQSPYGHLVVTESGGQRTFFQQGMPLFTTQDTAAREERVHFALAQREPMSSILLVGGAACRAADEALKYAPRRVDCVEPDPAVLAVLKDAGGAATQDPRVTFIETDARRYLRTSGIRYDAIILGLPAPESVQLNRFYTREFFAETAARLTPGGVVSLDLPGSEGYLSPSQKALLASIRAALQSSFRHTLVIPGEKTILLGSSQPLRVDVPAILARRGIPARFMTEGYLASRLTPERLQAVRAIAAAPSPPNEDFSPVSYRHALNLWLEKTGGNLVWPTLVFAALILAIGALFFGGPAPSLTAAIATTGFAGISMEIVLVVGFQVLYGSLYLHMGALFAAFMIGTAAGSALALRGGLPGEARGLQLLDAAFVALAPASAAGMQALATAGAPSGIGPVLIGLALAAAGFIVGAQFPLATRMRRAAHEPATFFYAADLLGACLGAFATAALLLPAIGLTGVCWLLAGLKLASLLGLRLAPSREATASVSRRSLSPEGWVVTGCFVLTGILIVSENTHLSVYSLTFSSAYVGALLIVIFLALWTTRCRGTTEAPARHGSPPRPAEGWLTRRQWFSVTRIGGYFLFGLVAFFPIFRCYFRIPYIFCHVCPRQCIFGYLRPYLVGGALLVNLGRHPFCHRICPIGTLLDAQAPPTPPAPWIKRVLGGFRLAVLALVVLLYFPMEPSSHTGPSGTGSLYTFFFRNDYSVSLWVIVAAAALIVLGWRIKRSFCLALCPIGAVSDLATALIQKIPAGEEGGPAAKAISGSTGTGPGGTIHG